MLLTHLSLVKYRNLARLDIDLPGGSIILVGGNAQGKTSILESIYYLASFTSFHASNDRQLISFVAKKEPQIVAKIIAEYRQANVTAKQPGGLGGKHRLEVRIILEENGLNNHSRVRKEILLDGVKKKVGEAIGFFHAVLFLPQMLRVVEGPPEERRRYLDLAMSQALPHYAMYLAEYNQILSQRNALLKQLGERSGDEGQLIYWDEQLADYGAKIIHARISAARELELVAARYHDELTHGKETLRLSYLPAYDPLPCKPHQYTLPIEIPVDFPVDRSNVPVEEIQSGFLERLGRLRTEEINRGVTTIGPHRDDLRFISSKIDLGVYGSRGQGRTAVLALKLAEMTWMKEKTGQWPVLLLDEVMAELDPERRMDLLGRLLESEQVILTTTDLDLFNADFVKKSKIWRIRHGQVIVDGLT
jgi:DNA replication and repair protein RecF